MDRAIARTAADAFSSSLWKDPEPRAPPLSLVTLWYAPANLSWGMPLKRRAIRKRSLRVRVGKMAARENGGLLALSGAESAGESGLCASSEHVSPGKYVVFSRVPRSPANSRDCVADLGGFEPGIDSGNLTLRELGRTSGQEYGREISTGGARDSIRERKHRKRPRSFDRNDAGYRVPPQVWRRPDGRNRRVNRSVKQNQLLHRSEMKPRGSRRQKRGD